MIEMMMMGGSVGMERAWHARGRRSRKSECGSRESERIGTGSGEDVECTGHGGARTLVVEGVGGGAGGESGRGEGVGCDVGGGWTRGGFSFDCAVKMMSV